MKTIRIFTIAILAMFVLSSCNYALQSPIVSKATATAAPVVCPATIAAEIAKATSVDELNKLIAQCGGANAQVAADPTNGSVTTTAYPNPVYTTDQSHGSWTIKGTDLLVLNPIVADWISRLQDPAPAKWQHFPNVPEPLVPSFRVVTCEDNPSKKCVPDGMEYGTYNTPYCYTQPCDFIVGGREYRYYTGTYKFLDVSCTGDKTKGCMLVVIDVANDGFVWRGQYFDNGFTLRGRYWNGDKLDMGLWGLISHGSANLLNMPTFAAPGEVLNAGGDSSNSGNNCSNQTVSCPSVDVNVFITAMDAVIAELHTVVSK